MSESLIYINEKAEHYLLDEFLKQKSIFVLCDTNTKKYCLGFLKRRLPQINDNHILCVPDGEKSKDIAFVVQLWEALLNGHADRNSLLINLGGGVICDLGGFVASTFKRGISFLHIPTSLTAQVDAAIGGKTAININGMKNQVGTFQQASAVLIFNELLRTLPEKQLYAGYAEMLKHALIADKIFWEQLKEIKKIKSIINQVALIEKSVQIKTTIVEKDFYELNERRLLNFGHTMGHILESFLLQINTPVLHGEAVAWGMLAEAYLSMLKGYISINELNEIQNVIKSNYRYLHIQYLIKEKWMPLLVADKKRVGDELNFTLLEGIGKAIINQQCNTDEIQRAIDCISE